MYSLGKIYITKALEKQKKHLKNEFEIFIVWRVRYMHEKRMKNYHIL